VACEALCNAGKLLPSCRVARWAIWRPHPENESAGGFWLDERKHSIAWPTSRRGDTAPQSIGTRASRYYFKRKRRNHRRTSCARIGCAVIEEVGTMIVDCFTETERIELREYISLGTLPRSPFLIACLDGDEELAASIDRERAKFAVSMLSCFFPPKAHGAPTKVAHWHKIGGACGQRIPKQQRRGLQC
jgi:hypothetical protein